MTLRSVWSFWSKPFQGHYHASWASEKHHLLAWILSFETARRHYPQTSLCTDDEGARLLVDGLGLEFDHVSTELNALSGADSQWWTLGKLTAYGAQRQPFIHIDNDVFLWNPLPEPVASAPVFAQNPEEFDFGADCWYRPAMYDRRLRTEGGWWPPEWEWYVRRGGDKAACCGILGGQDWAFLNHYGEQAIRFLTATQNLPLWQKVEHRIGDNILFEQYLLLACLGYHTDNGASRFRGVHARYLFQSSAEAFTTRRPVELGYTHLIGGAKRNPHFMERLEQRVERDYPARYRHCLQYLERNTRGGHP